MAQLSQLMAVYNDGWKPDWGDDKFKYKIKRDFDVIIKSKSSNYYDFLTFKTSEIRNKFLKNFEPLIKQFFELDDN